MRRLPGGQFARWCGGSAASFAVNLGTSVLLHEGFGVDENAAVAVAYATTFCANFVVQRWLIFDARHHHAGRQAAAFAATSVAFRVAEYGLFLLLHEGLGVFYLLAQILVAGLGFFGKYFFYRRWVFGPGKTA